MKRLRGLNQSGVTLIELLIATTIFSVILVIILYAFLFISNNYTKGLVESRTQEAARAALEQISQDIQLNSANVVSAATVGSVKGTCVGNHLYSYQFNKELGSGPGDVSHALEVRTVSGCGSSTNASFASGGKELLGQHMRLGSFSITPNDTVAGQYTISLTVAYGDDASQDNGPLNVSGSGAPYTYSCPSINVGGDFCADLTLSMVVQQR